MTGGSRAFRLTFDDASQIATFAVSSARLSPLLATRLDATVDRLLSHAPLRGVIICPADSEFSGDFCSGTDVETLVEHDTAAPLLAALLAWHGAVRQLETAGLPVVTLLAGSVEGAGFELALASHHRIALDDGRLRVGLTDQVFGLLPCGGGGQRLCRLVGILRALDILSCGHTLEADEAKRAGLIDQLYTSAKALRPAAERWIAEHPQAQQPWDREDYVFPAPAPRSRAASELFLAATAGLYKKTAGALEAPKLLLSALQEGTRLDFDRALELEARFFVRSALSPQADDMTRTLLQHKGAAKLGLDLPASAQATAFDRVAIVGAGMMGAELAFVVARAGFRVVLTDISPAAIEGARNRIETLATREPLAGQQATTVIARIDYALDLSEVQGASLLIEAVFEDLQLKQRLLAQTEPLLVANGIWASNTSALPIAKIGARATHAGRLLGLHFFSPVSRMELVEVVKTRSTEQSVIGRALGFCRQLGKVPIVVNDGYGFYTTRVFAAYVLEGMSLLSEGVEPARIEWEARAAGMLVGPLQVADEVSLQLVQHIIEQRRQFGRPLAVTRAEQVLAHMLEHQRPGRTGGAGFYCYRAGRRHELWPGLSELAEQSPCATPPLTSVSVGHRLLLAQAVEAARAIDEGVVERQRDAEIGAVLGVGFAPSWGGPLSYLDRVGIDWAVAQLEQLAQSEARFAPPALLRAMAAEKMRFFGPRRAPSL